MSALRHVVLFRIHDDVDDSAVAEAVAQLRALSVLPGVASWRVEWSVDQRKGRVIIEDATFSSHEDFERFRLDPRHTAVGERMAKISDWWNGDYVL